MVFLGELRVVAALENLRTISHFLQGIGQRLHLTEDALFDLDLAVEEASANIVNHAYSPGQAGEILLRAERAENALHITITDWGLPFDAKDIEPFDIQASLEAHMKRGTGLYLINSLMDSVMRTPASAPGGPNVLTLIKHLGPDSFDTPTGVGSAPGKNVGSKASQGKNLPRGFDQMKADRLQEFERPGQIRQAFLNAEAQELALAGQIQAKFIPDYLPEVPGWQLSAILHPARETSGDFYDVIPLPNSRFAIVVGDVAGKGMGAALFMALSRTLLRTYAVEYHARPDYVMSVTNRRILMDTKDGLFVTVFYGVLDPASGTLTYCNAGHNPGYLLSAQKGGAIQELARTGIPLGITKGLAWKQGVVQIDPGDALLLYSDGITEAQNAQEDFFDEERLGKVALANLGRSAQEMQDAVIAEVREFVGDAPQFDDITLMAVVRDQ